ncbi:MAG: hypothetical protein ACOVOI_02605, partial [Hyphomicrobiales bacterium]
MLKVAGQFLDSAAVSSLEAPVAARPHGRAAPFHGVRSVEPSHQRLKKPAVASSRDDRMPGPN